MAQRYADFQPNQTHGSDPLSPTQRDDFSRDLEQRIQAQPVRSEDLTPDYLAGDPTNPRDPIGRDALIAAIDQAVHQKMFPHEHN